jgi:hypothetical protein
MLSIQLFQYGAVLSYESVELRIGFNQADLGLDQGLMEGAYSGYSCLDTLAWT